MGGAELEPAEGAVSGLSRADALAASERVTIDSPRLSGSIALTGAVIDDVLFRDYRETVDLESPNITLFNPSGSRNAYLAKFGWSKQKDIAVPRERFGVDRRPQLPDPGLAGHTELGQRRGPGLRTGIFARPELHVLGDPARPQPGAGAGVTANLRVDPPFREPKTLGFYLLHEGLLGVFDDTLTEVDYDDLEEAPVRLRPTEAGWALPTNTGWPPSFPIRTRRSTPASRWLTGRREYLSGRLSGTAGPDQPGGDERNFARLFVGAKELSLLDRYADEANVPNFDLAVDFGWFYFLTKPMFITLDVLNGWWGNFGLAILTLTLIIKALLFPIANKSYKSMSKMKLLAPKMKELKERYGDDRMRLNQETMELYKREKVNPAAGCLPIIPQMIIFFALYKVLFVSIEMRHAPFFGWIVDLSAPDPLGVLTLFGLIDWQVPAFLTMFNIGIWPILMGLSMYAMQKLNPPPPDPMQARIMGMLPLVFTFFLATFPAGLVLYWTWNNLLSIAQQWTIMKRMEKQMQQPKLHHQPSLPNEKGGGRRHGPGRPEKRG